MSLDGGSPHGATPGPPLVRVDALKPGQVVRPYVGFAPWRVESVGPIHDDQAGFWLVVIRALEGERVDELEALPDLEIAGDWEKPDWWPEGVV